MAKVRNLSDTQQQIAFTEHDFYQLTNYKLIDSILLELSKKLKIQEQQKLLADAWKPYMKNLDTVYTDASCYESLMFHAWNATLREWWLPT